MFNESIAELYAETTMLLDTTPAVQPATLHDDIAAACSRIAPLWDLSNYVAVNPFLGFSAQPLLKAAQTIEAGLGAPVLPHYDFYRTQWQAKAFDAADLSRAANGCGYSLDTLVGVLNGHDGPTRTSAPVYTFVERHDRQHGTRWNERLTRHVTLWCSTWSAGDVAQWAMPQTDRELFSAWREAAQVDRSLEIAGLKGWRAWVAALPESPTEAIETLLPTLGVNAHERQDYFYRLLGGVLGWASLLRRASWSGQEATPGQLADLLAIRVCCDAAVMALAPKPTAPGRPVANHAVEDEGVRLVFQAALENGYVRRLAKTIRQAPQTEAVRPLVQAIFCIDVRSEILRRHLEAQGDRIETRGFAGFFGVSLAWHADGEASARCPVLLSPAVQIEATNAPAKGMPLKQLWFAPASAYTCAETLGLGYAAGVVGDTLALRPAPDARERDAAFTLEPKAESGIAPAARIDLAAGILKNTGLGTATARLVLLCGHESHSANNAHAAGLDCGACGGHGGAINARVAAALLNDPAVRIGIRERGHGLPEDTWFVPAVHNTSTDDVTLLDTEHIPASHHGELAQVRAWLGQAGKHTQAERAMSLGLTKQTASMLDRLLRRRGRDWAEVRPEWALARNAAFIAARRSRTRGADLGGRTFLHEYDWTTDGDNSILELILSAPVVVASWINLQYLASTVDNDTFGCGTKPLHNRIGSLGVVLGNGGDLRTGLALQSVQAADGTWYHEPLRLQVIVEAPRARLDAALQAHPQVRDLFANDWIRLFALDSDSNKLYQWSANRGWIAV